MVFKQLPLYVQSYNKSNGYVIVSHLSSWTLPT